VVIPFKQHVCRLVLCMANEHHTEIAEEVRSHSTLVLANPTTEALSALCFAYFDTRRSPLAEINLMDLSNSPFLANRITRNTREGFNIVRCVFLFRGMMKACQVEASMVEVWESDARASLVEMNLPVPSLFVARGRRFATRAWLGAQKALNVGAGARLNTLQAFVASASASSSARDSQARRGSVREGLAVSPGTPRRMRSASW
jgi:aarF domain-containing kinase|tara:strand:+ start:6645 stop:7253 length:609 start_codon:yes stop_codon:yes gene_type:complete